MKNKKQMEKIKNKTKRLSVECEDCLYNKKCDWKYSIALFEETHNVEIDCWKRKVYYSIFCTGLHKPLFAKIEDPLKRGSLIYYKWFHALNEIFDVEAEDYLDN